MTTTPDPATLTATLDDLEQRERWLKQARGGRLSWSDAPTLLVLGASLYFYPIARDATSGSTLTVVMAVVILGEWERRRLSARINALVQVLSRSGA